MDKFGIFNLLNSFAKQYLDNKSQNNQPKTTNSNAEFSAENVTDKNAQLQKNQNAPFEAPYPPLQNGMISTMKSHDEFIKRVQKNAEKLKT